MKSRAGWICLAVLLLAGCDCYAQHDGDRDGEDGGVDPDAGPVRVCEDDDADGYGVGPDCLGADCDDGDEARHVDCAACDPGMTEPCYGGPDGTVDVGLCRRGERACLQGAWGDCVGAVLPADESCDGVDQDCSGVVDDGFGTCGDCDPSCRMVCAGVDCPVALSEGERIEPIPGGAIRVLEGAYGVAPHVLWISDRRLGTVYQIDTRSYDVRGVYQIGLELLFDLRVATVDARGNAFVCAQRLQGSTLSRIDAADCVDADGSGVIDTSSGRDDLLPAGEDECVRWTVPLDPQQHSQLAASGAYGADGRLWMGLLFADDDGNRIAEYDPDTGELLQTVPVTPVPYVLTGDADGLWIAGFEGLSHVGIDGAGEVVHSETWTLHVAVGQEGRLILGPPVSTYDPVSRSLVVVDDEEDTYSMTVDGLGQTWALREGSENNLDVRRWDAAFDHLQRIRLERASSFIVADLDEQVWAAAGDGIDVYDAATGDHLASVLDGCDDDCITHAGFFGDVTGTRLHATMPQLIEHGEVRATFDVSCAPGEQSSPRLLTLDAEQGMDLVVETRSASADRLATASWQRLAEGDEVVGDLVVPVEDGASQVSVEVRVRFRGERGGTLSRIGIQWHCNPAGA